MISSWQKDLQFSPTALQWKRIGIIPHHGINLPLFSLHTSQSTGIGEFLDLLPLLSWCSSFGFNVLQLLPLNDTGTDSSPYNAISSCALHPLYLSLHALPHIQKYPEIVGRIKSLQSLNAFPRIDYEKVRQGKNHVLEQYLEKEGPSLIETATYRKFLEENPWLDAYALFKTLKQSENFHHWENWPKEISSPSPETYAALLHEQQASIRFHKMVQFLCFQQWEMVKIAAEKEKVFLKGDIPILINRDSADVWTQRDLFDLGFSAGAPPDMYNQQGQNWGFPLYRWNIMAQQQYRWWEQRLKTASRLYHIYRLDHIVGFYRIWSIPSGYTAKDGHFIPQDPNSWIPHGEAILKSLLSHSAMLPIGEDLGVIPPEVRVSLRTLGICGTKVMRWERRWETDHQFIPVQDYAPLSMTTVSTHDSETLAGWWKGQPSEAQEYAREKGWAYTPFLSLHDRTSILRDSHHSSSLFHINLLQEYLAYVPELSWQNPEEDRINVPGTVSDKNWTYKFRCSVEEITSHSLLQQYMQNLLSFFS